MFAVTREIYRMDRLERIAETFESFEDSEDRYHYLMELGQSLPALPEALPNTPQWREARPNGEPPLAPISRTEPF